MQRVGKPAGWKIVAFTLVFKTEPTVSITQHVTRPVPAAIPLGALAPKAFCLGFCDVDSSDRYSDCGAGIIHGRSWMISESGILAGVPLSSLLWMQLLWQSKLKLAHLQESFLSAPC